jgi:hypothetical protein
VRTQSIPDSQVLLDRSQRAAEGGIGLADGNTVYDKSDGCHIQPLQ